jgi:hypothetical protein
MSNNPLHASFMQRIFASKQNKPVLEPTRPAKTSQQAEVKRYISLRIYQAEQALGDVDTSPVQYLEAGQRYYIVLQCDETGTDYQQRGVTINRPFKLHLRYSVDNSSTCPFDFPQDSLTFEEPFHHQKIPFELPLENCPSCQVTFSAIFLADGDIISSMTDQQTLSVRGNCTPEDAQWLEARYIDTSVPKNTIVLSARDTDTPSDVCLVAAWNYYYEKFCESIDMTFSVNVAEASIRGLKKKFNSHIDLLRALRAFSRGRIGNLMRWIKQVKAQVEKREKQLSIVIFDSTYFEIPWELLEISDDDVYIGAVAQVARWLPLSAFGEKHLLKIGEYLCEGSVISYLDQYLPGTIKERELLQVFEHSETPSFDAFKIRLMQPLHNVGLLYIASHGSNGKKLFATPTSGSTPHADESSLNTSWLLSLRKQDGARPILFINACESARIIYDKDSYAYNLVKGFLLPCASNYIGTIANVSDVEAPRIARRILELAREQEGAPVAEILRRLRAEAVKMLITARHFSPADKEYTSIEEREKVAAAYVLNTFSYVYYGNPRARLRLHSAQRAREEA